MNREEIKIRLQALVERYNQTTRLEAKENVYYKDFVISGPNLM